MKLLVRVLALGVSAAALIACTNNQSVTLPVDGISVKGELQLTQKDGDKSSTFILNSATANSIVTLHVVGDDKNPGQMSFSAGKSKATVTFGLNGATRDQALSALEAGQKVSVSADSTGQNAALEVALTGTQRINDQFSQQESCQIPVTECYGENHPLPLDVDDHGHGGGDHDGDHGHGGGGGDHDGDHGGGAHGCRTVYYPGTEFNTYQRIGAAYMVSVKISQGSANTLSEANVAAHFDDVKTTLIQTSGCH